MDFGIGGEKFLGYADHRGCRRGDAQIIEEHRCDPFVHQNPPVLRIIEKLDHVAVAVGRLDLVRLCSAAHLADQAARINRHAAASSPSVTRK